MSDTVKMSTIPNCDTHPTLFPDETIPKATVDGKTLHGPWAYMCDDCHDRLGVGLGAGKGQRFVTGVDTPPDAHLEQDFEDRVNGGLD